MSPDPIQIASRVAPDSEALAAYWCFVEEHQEALQRHVYEAAQGIPEYAQILAGMSGAGTDGEHANAVQRRAYIDGEWGELLDDLLGKAEAYARSGVSFSHWFGLLSLFRAAFTERCHSEPSETAARLMRGFDVAMGITVPALGSAFVDSKERILREANTRLDIYTEMFDAAPYANLVFEPRAGGLYLHKTNRPAVELCGARVVDEHREHPLSDAAAFPFMRDGLTAEFMQVLETGEPLTWTTQRGNTYFDCRVFRLRHEGHLGLVFADTTERHRQLAAIQQHMAEVKRSNRDLDDFAYVASHDLKSPLSDVRNLASWLAEDVAEQLPDRSMRHLELLGTRIERMEGLLDDLLEYSRVGRKQSPAVRFQLAEVFATVKAQLAIPKGFVLEWSGDLSVEGPRPPLETVLRNLIANAIKHHDRNTGTITLAAASDAEWMTLSVTDDGPGIEPAHFERIFRIFQTLRPRDEVEGSGVGLAIVKKSVEQFGGEVEVQSSGRGTTFEFTWPLIWPRPEEST